MKVFGLYLVHKRGTSDSEALPGRILLALVLLPKAAHPMLVRLDRSVLEHPKPPRSHDGMVLHRENTFWLFYFSVKRSVEIITAYVVYWY